METNILVILGAGGYANTVCDVAEQLGYKIFAVLDDKLPGFELMTFDKYLQDGIEFMVALGNNEFRIKWMDTIKNAGGKLSLLIHPSAYVSPKAVIEEGTVVLPKAIVNTGAKVERGCIINLGCIIDHDCVIEEGVHICLGAVVKGENRILRCEKIEAGDVVERATRK